MGSVRTLRTEYPLKLNCSLGADKAPLVGGMRNACRPQEGENFEVLEWSNRNSRAIVALCNLSVVVLGVLTVVLYLRHPPTTAHAPAVGSKFALPHGGSTADGDVLYVAMSAQCGVCESEADSYRSLEQALDGVQGATVMYLMPEREAAGRWFLNRHGLRGGVEFGTAFRGSGITGFPTVLLVDRQSIVRFSHTGRLMEDDKQRLETAVSQRSAPREADGKVSSGK